MRNDVFVMELGNGCNNNCIFCLEGNQRSKEYDLESLKRASLESNRVELSHGEPTLNKRIFEYVELAKEAGFKEIEVTSNGRMYSVPGFVEKLAKAGVMRFKISIHGGTPQVHNAMTRTPKSFEQAIKGLKNINKIKKKYCLEIHILMVITKMNYNEMSSVLSLFLHHNVDFVVFNLFESRNAAKKRAKILMPDYSLVETAFNRALAENSKTLSKKSTRVVISLPICVIRDKLRRHYSNYEVIKRNEGSAIKSIPTQKGKIFTNECKKCKMNSVCDGVWEDYLEIYGDRIFKAQDTSADTIKQV